SVGDHADGAVLADLNRAEVVEVGPQTDRGKVAGHFAGGLDRQVSVFGIIDAAAGVAGGVAGHGTTAESHRAVVPDRPAVVGGVVRQRASRDGRVHRVVAVVVHVGVDVGQGPAAARQNAAIPDGAALAVGRRASVTRLTAAAPADAAGVVGIEVHAVAVDERQTAHGDGCRGAVHLEHA